MWELDSPVVSVADRGSLRGVRIGMHAWVSCQCGLSRSSPESYSQSPLPRDTPDESSHTMSRTAGRVHPRDELAVKVAALEERLDEMRAEHGQAATYKQVIVSLLQSCSAGVSPS